MNRKTVKISSMSQTGLAEELMKNEEVSNSRKTSSEHIFSTPENSRYQLAEIAQMLASRIDDIEELDIFESASNSTSNFPTFLNNELEIQDLVDLKWTLGKEETHSPKTLEKEFEGVKISEISSENDIATNTNITQDRFLKEETNPCSQSLAKDSACSCLSKDLVKILKEEILKEIPLVKGDNLISDTDSTEKCRKNGSRKRPIPKEKNRNACTYSLNYRNKKQDSEKIVQKCPKACDQYLQKFESEVRAEELQRKSSQNQHRLSQYQAALKCKLRNAFNEDAVSEFSSRAKPASNSTGPYSETWNLEHTCESIQETSSIIPKIQRDALTIPKPRNFPKVSKCCRSKETPMSSKTASSIDPRCQDIGCEQKQDFLDSQSNLSCQQRFSLRKRTNPEAPQLQKLDCKRPSQSSSSSSRSRSRSAEQRTSLDTCKVSKLSDGSASRSIEWSSSSCSEFNFVDKKDPSQKSSLSFPAQDDKMPFWSMMQFCKIPSPDSSLEFLQDKITSLLNDDEHMDIVTEMAKLTERNIKLEDELSQKESKIDKLAQRSESVIERCEQIEVGLVSNLVITDERISKLSRAMKIAKRFQTENNSLWLQIEKLRDMLAEKDRRISKLLLLKSNYTRRDETRFLKEKINYLESENAALSTSFRKSEKMCKHYEKDLEVVERNLKRAEDKLRSTFVDLKTVVRTQAAKRKPLGSENFGKEIENSMLDKEDMENSKNDTKETVREVRAESKAPTKKDSVDKPGERIDESEAHTGHITRKSYKISPFRKTSQEVNGSSEMKRSQGV